jgi:hypothetical protein
MQLAVRILLKYSSKTGINNISKVMVSLRTN